MEGCKSQGLKNYTLGNEYRFIQKTSSKGTQLKYTKDGYWYKINKLGYEDCSERLASMVLAASDAANYVIYEQCLINGRNGCRSKNFLKEQEEFITFQNLYSIYFGGELSVKVQALETCKERIAFVRSFIFDVTGFDCLPYLSRILTLDLLILNEDRHFHNLGILRTPDGYREAPIFDNGNSLLSDYNKYPAFLTEEEWKEELPWIAALPFSGSFEQQVLEVGLGLHIEYRRLAEMLQQVPQCRAKNVLQYQLVRYKKELCK